MDLSELSFQSVLAIKRLPVGLMIFSNLVCVGKDSHHYCIVTLRSCAQHVPVALFSLAILDVLLVFITPRSNADRSIGIAP